MSDALKNPETMLKISRKKGEFLEFLLSLSNIETILLNQLANDMLMDESIDESLNAFDHEPDVEYMDSGNNDESEEGRVMKSER
jgi:hypothetical protein